MIKQIVIFALLITIIDSIWLRFVMSSLYKKWFNNINIKMSFNTIAVILAYSLMILTYPLVIKNTNSKKEILNAVYVGFLVYGIYGFTVAAIFPKYNLAMALLETVWGTILYGSVTFLTQLLS